MSYPSDLKDSQWELIKDHFNVGKYGNRATHEKRHLVNAVFYLTKTGCQWRQLPKDFPPWSTVHTFYYRMKKKGIWEKIMNELVKKSRIQAGRKPDPTYALIDSQSVKTTSKAIDRGIDGEKKVKGQKRHITTDTLGHMLYIQVHAANTRDTVGGCSVFEKTLEKYPTLKGVCADAGYRKTMEEFVKNICKKTIEISERISEKWQILPKRWVIERTLSWFNGYRRLAKDFEISTDSAENYAMIALNT